MCQDGSLGSQVCAPDGISWLQCQCSGEGEGEGEGEGAEGEGEGAEGEGEGAEGEGEGAEGEGEGAEGEGEGAEGEGEGAEGEGEGGGEGEGEGAEGEGEGEGEQCGEERPCSGRQVCQGGRCVEPAACEGDQDCLRDRRCYARQCVDPCRQDADCPGSRACVDGLCPEPAVCASPEDCDAGRVCVAGTCTERCSGANPCPGALICDAESGRCGEASPCGDSTGCLAPRVCAAGVCTDPCADNMDCAGTRSCDLHTGLCPEPELCIVPEDCDPGRVCHGQRCQPGCDAEHPCPGRQVCDPQLGICGEPDLCEQDLDCLAGRICEHGVCAWGCVDDGSCPGLQHCEAGRCLEPERCSEDLDCLLERVCEQGRCIDEQCVLHEDCPELCLNRECVAALPGGCGAGEPCPAGSECALEGVCASAAGCTGDHECPALLPRCELLGGTCEACLVSADCAPGQRCRHSVCEPAAGCQADEECPGSRTCVVATGGCEPAGGCAGDRFDGLGLPAQLEARAYSGLVLCDGALDRFRVRQAEAYGLEVQLVHAADAGDLSLELVLPDSGLQLSHSDGPWGLERAALDPQLQSRQIEVVVRGRPGFDVPYLLDVRQPGVLACAPDALDVPIDNATAQWAAPLGSGPAAISLCPQEVEWYALLLAAGTHLRLTANVPPQGLEMELLGPDLVAVGQVEMADPGSVLEVDVAEAGRYLLRLEAADPESRLAVQLGVEVAAGPDAAEHACAEAPLLLADQPLPLPPTLPAAGLGASCGQMHGADHVARIELQQAAQVSLRVGDAGWGTLLSIRERCADPESEHICVLAQDEATLEAGPLEAGTWYVLVTTPQGLSPELELELR